MNQALTGVVLDGSGSLLQTAQPIGLAEGESFVLTVTVKHADGSAFDLTGYTSVITTKKSKYTDSFLFELPGVTVSAVAGTLTFTGDEDSTRESFGDYVYDVWITETATDSSYRVIPRSLFTIDIAVSEP